MEICILASQIRTVSSISVGLVPIFLTYHMKYDDLRSTLEMRRVADELHLSKCSWKGLTSVKVSQMISDRKTRKWLVLALAAFLALQIYFVQEMLAALFLFTAVFAVLAIVALVLYVIDRVGQWGLGWAGERARPVGQLARRGWTAAEEFSKKPFHRPRSETAP